MHFIIVFANHNKFARSTIVFGLKCLNLEMLLGHLFMHDVLMSTHLTYVPIRSSHVRKIKIVDPYPYPKLKTAMIGTFYDDIQPFRLPCHKC